MMLGHRIVVALLVTAATSLTAPVAGTPAAATLCSAALQGPHVAVLVEHSGGAVVTGCVRFSGTSVSGLEALAASGIPYSTSSAYAGSGNGAAICAVDGEPLQYPPDCFSGQDYYWQILVDHGGTGWKPSSRGISSLTLQNGDALGLHYIPQSGATSLPPDPGHICDQVPATQSPSHAPPTTTRAPAATPAGNGAHHVAATGSPTSPSDAPEVTSEVKGIATSLPATNVVASAAGPSAGVFAGICALGCLGGLMAGNLVLRRRRR